MKREEWNESLNHIDADIIENYVEQKEKYIARNKRKRMWLKIGAMAASFVLIVTAIINPTRFIVMYDAYDMASLFHTTRVALGSSGATNAYTTKWTPDPQYLYIDPLPESNYLDIYKYCGSKKTLNKKEFSNFFDSIVPRFAKYLNIDSPEYDLNEYKLGEDNAFMKNIETPEGGYHFGGWQNQKENHFYLRPDLSTKSLKLDGEIVQIDQRLSDEEIIDSLESIKNKLFDIFGVTFSDAKILRGYDVSLAHGVVGINVFFYNKDAHGLNSITNTPVTDFIIIEFDNYKNSEGDIVSDSILKDDIRVRYVKYRTTSRFKVIAKQKKISLEEAEELLYNGYVFGGHSCPLCMAAQSLISFEDYDYVDFEYVFGENGYGTPFYAFYKKITPYWVESENVKYAKTYVPAIEVNGYEEYFEAQKQVHKS